MANEVEKVSAVALADIANISGITDANMAKIAGLEFSAQEFITATGGTVSTDGDYKVHKFTSDGTFTVTGLGSDSTHGAKVRYLLVAGGGGAAIQNGGYGAPGAGGAGGGGYCIVITI